MPPIIEVNNLGKKYRYGQRESYLALRDTLTFMIKSPLRWAKSKMVTLQNPNEFWALKDVNFNVEKGEVLGIIGRNGAGKSTLLKVLSKITPPTTGEVRLRGVVGSLLEVGTGFHPELTGRENIFLNGAILGMKRREIVAKINDIIEFSGVEKFIDTPVKRYSSGMYVRLAFSVAAHLEPDILIIDEVLSVGDAEFQKKSLGKMEEVTKHDGRTVLFVSHSMAAVQAICSKVLLLDGGKVKAIGKTSEVIEDYINDINAVKDTQVHLNPDPKKEITFTKIWVTGSMGNTSNSINVDEAFTIWLEFQVNKPMDDAEISIGLKNSNGVNVTYTSLSDTNDRKPVPLKPGTYVTSTSIPGNFLIPDNYSIMIGAHVRNTKEIEKYQDVLRLIIIETGESIMAPYGNSARYWSAVFSPAKWDIEKKN
jgi:lipopolysaccharide transport system ATP-binding protein